MWAKPADKPRSSIGKRKLLRFVVISCIVTSFTIFLWPRLESERVTTETVSNITITSDVGCQPDFEALRRLNVQKLTQYVRREVVASETPSNVLPLSQRLQVPLFPQKPHGDQLHLPEELLHEDCLIPNPVSLQVPTPPRHADASHIDFGVATTIERLNDSLDAFSHWAGYTNAHIFALVEPDERAHEVLLKADALGINLSISESSEEYQRRYFSLVPHLAKNARPETKWSCVMDDDTFFLSMPELVKGLKEYDETKPMYVGGLSESIPQVGVFGLMGFGGAGVFLSRPLIQELSRPEVFEDCQRMDVTGDRRISLCIYQYTSVRLTIDHRLHQLDMMGDVSGFFEAERQPPLSVHHWKSWFHADMAKASAVTEICGDSCLLRKWHFGDGWILTNGFSVVKYSSEKKPGDRSMELTWDSHNGAVFESYLHELGPLRLKDEGKISYLHEDAIIDGNRVRQWYVHRDPEQGDQVLELIWRAA
ncbi:glycosyltransferase family 31 protein [Aspergillus luchuensis]|uniref:Uncharacterized protein n=2 Tax=Aspergillus kawachii TaxID=1069201 RepID=A0A7R7W600_ASPKA|nr:uncharacterized protein AKAW2_30316A [Aspergillus luchuensis]BCR96997.1 hypothetical protein AKAW2_30316A [Aspergillus luchuensis]BCS09474.1 hypothetical protein ALUC_30291A [Aspergillus luchuensis]GAA91741.1 similar to An04g06900 [Aspergillus luchuensis IFO 4308]